MLYDISPPIDDRIKVWPGDEPPRREVKCRIEEGAPVTLSALHATVHTGSHADGPNHYGKGAPGIDSVPLERYLGPAQVIEVDAARGTRVTPGRIPDEITEERVLLKLGTYPDYADFNTDFAGLSVELIDFLNERGVRLVGTDSPSVDLFDSKDLPAHNAFLKNDMNILECLVLRDVPPGRYELIALPLKLIGFDASPVRAVLRPLG